MSPGLKSSRLDCRSQQQRKFESWFGEVGSKVANQGQQIGALAQSVQAQGQEYSKLKTEVEATMTGAVGKLQADMTTQLAQQLQLQSLLADKKSRTS